jgi:hypothetical protein
MAPRHDGNLPLISNANTPKQWRHNRMARFAAHQQRVREWICFREIADWVSELGIRWEEAPYEAPYTRALHLLLDDILGCKFRENGREQVLYLDPDSGSTKARMKRQLVAAILSDPRADVIFDVMEDCWIPRRMFAQWCARHGLPRSPVQFEPIGPSRVDIAEPVEAANVSGQAGTAQSAVTFPAPNEVTTPSTKRRRGPDSVKFSQTMEAMRCDVRERGIVYLADMKEKAFRAAYGVSRDTARKARKIVLSEFADSFNSDKLSSNDK